VKRFLIGVDEAGRGPLAGPVAVGIVKVRRDFNIKKHFPGVNDSKQLSAKEREDLYELMTLFARIGHITFVVRFASSLYIDKFGITRAVRRSIYSGVRTLAPESKGVRILLDGLLHAPQEYKQETIIRGDESEPVISLASIAAKVERDKLMHKLAKKFPAYGFEQHKGYGTTAHYKAIGKFGLCEIHRKSYCKDY